ncbi:MAG: histidine-type phosphatase [Prevotella sp.]|nr:histidine-type phosphatase [Prevotella sp.]
MRKVILFILFGAFVSAVTAQTAKEEIANNLRLSASNFLAYQGPQRTLTPAPEGMTPFYISHYGRHGSRFLANANEYDYPYNVLRHADSLGKLTPFGKTVLERVQLIRKDAEGRLGDLTPLGAQQHRQIARRMFERFPEVFSDGAHIDAKSTTVIRCILSMSYALQELSGQNPHLKITADASSRDMYYMNQSDAVLWKRKTEIETARPFVEFCARHDCSAHLMEMLFNDTAYVNRELNPTRFNFNFFKVASNIQNTELRRTLTLYDAYSDDDIYQNWLRENARFYAGFAACPLNDGTQPFSQRNLLRKIIAEADSCIKLATPSASLRFGHETMILPLVCLLDLNGYGMQDADLEQLARKGWCNYKIFPMAANIQLVFYRRHPGDTDVVFKVLLNEDEATLPLETDMPPYYHWADFRKRYLKLLDSYVEQKP